MEFLFFGGEGGLKGRRGDGINKEKEEEKEEEEEEEENQKKKKKKKITAAIDSKNWLFCFVTGKREKEVRRLEKKQTKRKKPSGASCRRFSKTSVKKQTYLSSEKLFF